MESEQSSVTEILHQVKSCRLRIHHFRNQISKKHTLVCLGSTRAGKSTLVNYILRNQLEAFLDGKRIYIKEKNSAHEGPIISHGSMSCTKLPTVWELRDKPDTIVVDVPGFGDNRGIAHEIVNTLFFNELKHSQSVRFVLVTDVNDIDTDNVQAFTSVMTKMQTIIADFNELKGAVSVVFTKDCRNYQNKDIAALLKKKIVDVPEMQVKKDLVYHIIKHSNLIGIFRMPLQTGQVVREEVDCNVEIAINNSHPIILNTTKIKFVPSQQAHHTLLDIYQKYTVNMDFSSEIGVLVRRFDRYFKVDKYVFASTEEELSYTKSQLQFCLPRITTEKAKVFANIAELEESVCNLVGQLSQNLEQKLHCLRYMDDWLLLDDGIKQIVIKKYRLALVSLEDDVSKLMSKIDAEIEDRTNETIAYIRSEIASDKKKLIVMSSGLVPLAKKVLAAAGVEVPEITIEVAKLSGAAYSLAGAAARGVAAGGYGMHYYKTVYLRQMLRNKQGRS